eukprot:6200861-Pleurochrysis_carterae.AAC.2
MLLSPICEHLHAPLPIATARPQRACTLCSFCDQFVSRSQSCESRSGPSFSEEREEARSGSVMLQQQVAVPSSDVWRESPLCDVRFGEESGTATASASSVAGFGR